jgi:leucine dehydrogenase
MQRLQFVNKVARTTTTAAATRNFHTTVANKKNILQQEPVQFINDMKKAGIRRGYVIHNNKTKETTSSHPLFNEVAQVVTQDKRDFLGHEALFFEIGKRSDSLMAAFLHKTVRGAPQGGVRLWNYTTLEGMVRDGLRLSTGMSRKNAAAGLWWGGGKGIIVSNSQSEKLNFDDAKVRDAVFHDYGEFLTSLRGAYYGAEDVGLTPEDTARMFSKTRFMTCIPQSLGGSGNPSRSTGIGVVCAMESALDYLNMGSLKGKKVVIQGAGNVAGFMLDELLSKGVGKVVMSDISQRLIESRKQQYAQYKDVVEFRLAPADDNSILAEPCDILAPAALGGVLNSQSIPNIQCKIVCGAANNQLLDPVEHDHQLKQRGILYIPDYVANRMGIVNCANENYGYVKHPDPVIARHFGREWDNAIYNIVTQILKIAEKDQIPTGIAANMFADELCELSHPIWGHRSWDIIQGLVADKWAEQKQL